MREEHPLHEVIGDIVRQEDFPGCEIRKAPECGGSHHLPLFYSSLRSAATEFTNVDLLIVKEGLVRVVVEVEEVKTDPGYLLGKFVAPSVCWGYIYGPGDERAEVAEGAAFVQVLSTSGLPPGSAKPQQWRNVEEAIGGKERVGGIMPLRGSRITQYKLFMGDERDFRGATGRQLVAHMRSVLA